MQDSESRPQVTIGLNRGDMVKINTGPFDGFDGAVEEVNAEKGTVRVVVTIFGRPTPVDLKYWEVEAV
jgi:transcriptional antiterminator NusG